MAGLTHHSEVAAGVVFENDADVLRALIIFFNAFDDCDLPAQRDVQNVAALFGTQAHAIADPDRDAVDST